MKKKWFYSIIILCCIIMLIILLHLVNRHKNSIAKSDLQEYCKNESQYASNFEIYSLDEYDDYIFLVSESENSELFIFEKDTVFSSRYYYVTDSRGLVDDNTSIGIIIAYLKKNNEKESSKVLLSFSNNNIGITNCEYSYNDEIKNISIDPDKGFVFAISHSNFNYLMEEVVESMQFIDEKGNIIH